MGTPNGLVLYTANRFRVGGIQSRRSNTQPFKRHMPAMNSRRLLTALFIFLSFLGLLGRLGADTDYDEPIYCGISRSLWAEGRARTDDGVPGGALFKDSPVAVPFLLAPVSGLLKSLQSVRVAHWLLFVLPGLLILAVILSRAGFVGMAAGFFLFLINPYNISYATTHVNLDQGLSSWGLIAIYCFVSRKWLALGLFAMLLATLCKYQAAVVGLTLLAHTLFYRGAWKLLLLYGAVSAAAIISWLALVHYQDPSFLSAGFGRFSGSSYPWRAFIGSTPARLAPFALIAAVGVWRNRREPLIQCLAGYLILTLLFNMAAVRLPGGMNYYLTPAYLPLAACGGFAFVGVRSRICVLVAPACLCAALAKGFVAVPLAFAGAAGVVITVVALLASLRRPAWGLVALVGPLVVMLPHAEPICALAAPDEPVRTLLGRADKLTTGTWDDPRVPYWAHRPCWQAKWSGYKGVDYYILNAARDDRLKNEQPLRWEELHDRLNAEYVLDERVDDYSGWRRVAAP
jgi:hypothetical protein